MNPRCIYIDRDSVWWLAEAIDTLDGDIRLINPYPLDFKSAWEKITQKIGTNAQNLIIFFKDCEQHYEPLGNRKLLPAISTD